MRYSQMCNLPWRIAAPFLWHHLFAYKLDYVVILRGKPTSARSTRIKAIGSATDAPVWVRPLIGDAIETSIGGVRCLESAEFCLASLRLPVADRAIACNAGREGEAPVRLGSPKSAEPRFSSELRLGGSLALPIPGTRDRPASAGAIDGLALERAAEEAYRALRASLERSTPWHPVRIWNFVPGILADGQGGMDRYMRFNAGRYRAFAEWFGGAQGFDHSLPTASAVGHGGSDLVVHALAARAPGESIANPRQVEPHHYSRRFGPLPPCFARAIRVHRPQSPDLLLVGGTSSVRGEDSVHVGNLELQLAETLENLAALSRQAFGPSDTPLDRFRELRVYHFRAPDLRPLRAAIERAFPSISGIEWVRAELCRGDLLVEIEGLAEANSNNLRV